MRVVRGRSFVDDAGVWHKVEVELSSDDLLPEEQKSGLSSHATLLELRAEQYVLASLTRSGFITEAQAKEEIVYINSIRDSLISKPTLRKKSHEDEH
ncbi:MAG: hypothetical protein NWE76_01390 [Candidatus Bathyarchaeota archaeon]|nr:hypothetical protein [Candidatus Bathyarchaeota archaeon]